MNPLGSAGRRIRLAGYVEETGSWRNAFGAGSR